MTLMSGYNIQTVPVNQKEALGDGKCDQVQILRQLDPVRNITVVQYYSEFTDSPRTFSSIGEVIEQK